MIITILVASEIVVFEGTFGRLVALCGSARIPEAGFAQIQFHTGSSLVADAEAVLSRRVALLCGKCEISNTLFHRIAGFELLSFVQHTTDGILRLRVASVSGHAEELFCFLSIYLYTSSRPEEVAKSPHRHHGA